MTWATWTDACQQSAREAMRLAVRSFRKRKNGDEAYRNYCLMEYDRHRRRAQCMLQHRCIMEAHEERAEREIAA